MADPRPALFAAALIGFAAIGCQKPDAVGSLGTIQIGGVNPDPGFDNAWRRLAQRTGSDSEVFYIEDDRGEGLMGRVRRAAKAVPKPAPPPELSLDARAADEGDPELPDGEEVSAIVRSNLAAVKACYLRTSRTAQSPSGRAILSFTVSKEGAVENVRLEAPAFQGTNLARCITQQVQRWALPKSRKGGLAFSYPFVFVGG